MLTTALFSLALAAEGPATRAPDTTVKAKEKSASIAPLQWKGENGQMFRLILWSQFWARMQEHNPGTTINGVDDQFTQDIGIRRARVLMFGKPTERILILTHFGINNQTFNNARKPQMYIHDAWIQGDVVPKALTLGIGLHYWNGVSRQANMSTMGFLTIDSPIFPWVNIERTDQFARQFGIFAKGKISKLDYRIALNNPFSPGTTLADGGPVNYRPDANTWSVAGYAKVELADSEANTLPFLNGTYLGKKQVVNIGAGVSYQPDAMGQMDGDNIDTFDQLAIGADIFVDTPVGDGAFTAYGLYQYSDYGPDFVRNVGIMNLGGGGSSFAGGGTAYPMIGTGSTVYAETGYLLPMDLEGTRLQPYAAVQASFFDVLDEAMVLGEAGANWYIAGQNLKITAHWRNRPVFGPAGNSQTGRANEGIMQVAFRY